MFLRILLIIFTLNTFAKDPFTFSETQFNLKIGAGLKVKSNIRKNDTSAFKGNDPIIVPFPFIRFKIAKFELEPDKAKFTITKNLWWDFDIRAHYTGHEYNAFDMSHRHKTIFAGAGLRLLIFKAKVFKDTQNKSDATIAKLGAVIPLPLTDTLTILLEGTIEFWDKKYMDYYFGVKQSEAKIGREAYSPKSDKSYHFQLTILSRFSKTWLTRINFAHRSYGKEFENSPTVKRALEHDLMIGLVHEF